MERGKVGGRETRKGEGWMLDGVDKGNTAGESQKHTELMKDNLTLYPSPPSAAASSVAAAMKARQCQQHLGQRNSCVASELAGAYLRVAAGREQHARARAGRCGACGGAS